MAAVTFNFGKKNNIEYIFKKKRKNKAEPEFKLVLNNLLSVRMCALEIHVGALLNS